jgi:hypothetical protein
MWSVWHRPALLPQVVGAPAVRELAFGGVGGAFDRTVAAGRAFSAVTWGQW